MKNQIKNLANDLKDVKDLESLKQIKSKYTSNSTFLNDLKEKVKNAEPSEKQKFGKVISEYNLEIGKLLSEKKEILENSFFLGEDKTELLLKDEFKIKELDSKKGKLHPLTVASNIIHKYFSSLKYDYIHGQEVEEEKYNFNILNIPQDHPAREMQDTFYLEGGKLLRTHSTNITARELEKSNLTSHKSYSIGPVFRNDDNDATHSFQFNQVDIFAYGDDASIVYLQKVLNTMISVVFGKKIDVRYRPSYFPFTEPSFEVDMECPYCEKKGCNICSNSGYIEILGSGMLSPYVFKNAGKDSSFKGIAAGVGIERIAMIKWKIKDIRNFYLNEISFLKEYDK